MNLKEFGSGRGPFSHERVNRVIEIRIMVRETTRRRRMARPTALMVCLVDDASLARAEEA
jgi:hypothetical protein